MTNLVQPPPDHSGLTGCPVWCELPADHDLPASPVLAAEVTRREHAAILVDDDRLAYVEVVRADETIGDTGPGLIGTVRISVSSISEDMSRERFVQLVDALVCAQGAVEEIWQDETRRGRAADTAIENLR